MREWTIPSTGTAHMGFLLFETFSNQVLANAMEPLRAANTFLGRHAYAWRLLTLDGAPVRSSAGMQVVPDGALTASDRGAALILLPSYGYQQVATPALLRLLRHASGRFDTLVGIDGGAWALAAAGLLDGRKATIHYDEFDEFAEAFPAVDVARARWIDDGDRLTAGGAVAAFDMMMHLIARTHGTALTLRIASLFAVPDATTPGPLDPPGGDRRIRRALDAMDNHIEAPLTLPQIARRAGTTPKDLERRFALAFGASPRKVYQRIRLNAARNLVEYSTMEIAEIAARSGYNNAASFTRAFRQTFETTPRDIRRR
jgi:transcriptional regulator GlxA family with amidase domain